MRLIQRADGGLSVLSSDDLLELTKWESTAAPSWLPIVGSRCVPAIVFPARRWRDAWVDNGRDMVVDLQRARDQRLRELVGRHGSASRSTVAAGLANCRTLADMDAYDLPA